MILTKIGSLGAEILTESGERLLTGTGESGRLVWREYKFIGLIIVDEGS